MKRRDFLKLGIPATIAPMVLNNQLLSAFSMAAPSTCVGVNDRCLVVIQLFGGNDGLNTIVPIDQYSDYINLRPTVGLAQNSLINLDSTLSIQDQVGLHPVLTGMKSLYDNGKLGIVQGVGYPNQNGSHFSSTDFWDTGGDGTPANSVLPSGWAARYLTEAYPGYAGDPSVSSHPLAIQIGSVSNSKMFLHETEQGIVMNLSGQDPGGFYSIVAGLSGNPPSVIPNSEHGDQIRFILDVENNANGYSQTIENAFNASNNAVTYPSNNKLADQLKTVARLIAGGMQTKVYHVRLSGFDTHAAQVLNGATDFGTHADLLTTISEAVKAFQDDIDALGVSERVLTATVSEFGRKIAENGNFGTDHGRYAPMFLMGNGVNAGVLGTNITLSEATSSNNYQLTTMQYDYRQVLTSVVQDWLGACNDVTSATFYDNTNATDFLGQKVNVIHDNYKVDSSCYVGPACITASIPEINTSDVKIYPNPATSFISLDLDKSKLSSGDLFYEIYDSKGILVAKDEYIVSKMISVEDLSNGIYSIKLIDVNQKSSTSRFVKR